MDNVKIREKTGSLHFIRFPTAEMGSFLQLAKSKGSKFVMKDSFIELVLMSLIHSGSTIDNSVCNRWWCIFV